jgi:hypothetical protein
MSNKNLLTHNSKVSLVEQSYFSPVSTISGSTKVINTIYCFLAQIVPWTVENVPDVPEQSQKYIKTLFKNIFVVKKIKSNDISPIIQRVDWEPGIVYDSYSDNIDILAKNINGYNIYNFYVKNKYDQVFKCLWNNNNGISINEPFFQPGTYGTNKIFIDVDGYKWKYIYSVDIGNKTKYMDKNWLPVPIGEFTPNPLSSISGCGSLDVINVINGGSGFNPTISIINVVITGDGTGASAAAIVVNGIITDIQVTNPGTNYTYANVTISSNVGSGCIVTAPTSPIGGHGFDTISELGCNHVMYTVEFNGKETYDGIDYIPTNIDYRQIGLVSNPISKSSYPDIAEKDIYKVSTDLIVAGGFGIYSPDEIIYQGNSLETATFTANMLSFDSATGVISLINITGTPILNAPVFGNSSQCVRTLLNVSYPDFVPQSGYLTYIENRVAIQRSVDGIEQFKFVLEY